jgi:class 3 adenylate cyclase
MSAPAIPGLAVSDAILQCTVCSTANVASARFCGTCGTRLLFFCWSCGTIAVLGQQFCQICGVALALPTADGRDDGPAHSITVGSTVVAPVLAPVAPAAALAPGQAMPTVAAPSPGVPLVSGVAPAAAPASTAAHAPPSAPASPSSQSSTAPDVASAVRGSVAQSPGGRPSPSDADAADVEDQLVEERRVVTVLFADIVGFTTVSERLDPEDVRELSASVLARLAEAVALYGGTIDKFMGDAIMALFGAPTAHEDDPTRAVRAALAMHQAVSALRQLDRDGHELELRLRIGINSGEVIAGVRDVGGHREYSVFGDVVNTGARLQTAARPGGILLGEQTARQAGSVFDLQAVEPLVLKGKAQPVPAFEVRGTLAREVPALSPVADERGKHPLVGRLGELREIRSHLQELAQGRGRLTMVTGEHGVGKSRLLAEAHDHALELGLHWVEAMAPSHAQGLSYRLIREILLRLLDIQPGGSEARLAEALETRLQRLGLPELAAPLGLILGAEADTELTSGLTAQQLQWRVVEATRKVLEAMLADRPLVLVLDSLQWADPSSIEILIEEMALTDEAPILFVYVFTPEPDAPSWQLKEQAARTYPHRYAEIVLGPLPEAAARELICGLLSCDDTPGPVSDLVFERTDGNPFFIEEVLRALVEGGALRHDGDRWVSDADIRELEIPNTLLATVMARIDRLPAGVRRTLQIAAVIGREVSERVLRRVVDGGPEVDRHLREALRAGLLREEAVIPERRYAFTQALIHEAALRSLLVRRRREIHVQVGWALEEIYADNLEPQYGELARHFWEGESWERAFRYSRLTAEQAAAAYANDEAIAAFTMALESAGRSAAGAAPKVIALLAERRGDVRALVGEYDAALADYRSAIEYYIDELQEAAERDPEIEGELGIAELARAGGTSTAAAGHRAVVGTIAIKMARLHSYQGQIDPTRSKLALAFKFLAPDSPDLSSAWSLKAASYIWDTNIEAASEAGRRALQIARERGSFQHLGEAYEALTHPAMMGILGHDIGGLADEWVRLARARPEDRPALFKALTAHGLVHIWSFWIFSDHIRADTLEALEIAQATGSVPAENTARGILGIGLFLAGEWAEAEPELRRSAGQSTTLVGIGAIFEWWLMLLLTLKGDVEASADQMTIWLEDVRNTHRQVLMRALLGFNRLVAGDDAGARTAIAGAVDTAASLGCAQCDLTLDMFAAEVLAQLGDDGPALEHAARARETGARFGRPAATLAADRAEAVVAMRARRFSAARELLENARRMADRLGQPFEVARTLLLQAQANEASGNVWAAIPVREQAREILARLGAVSGERLVRSRTEPPPQV